MILLVNRVFRRDNNVLCGILYYKLTIYHTMQLQQKATLLQIMGRA